MAPPTGTGKMQARGVSPARRRVALQPASAVIDKTVERPEAQDVRHLISGGGVAVVTGNTRLMTREESACRKEMAYTADGKSPGSPGCQCSRGRTETIQGESADGRGTNRE